MEDFRPPAHRDPPGSWKGLAVPVLIFLGFIGAGAYWMRPRTLPAFTLDRAGASSEPGEDPCADKPRCLSIYVAPWCPSCRAASPVVLEIKERFRDHPKLGIRTVVGMDERPNLESYAKELGADVFLDPGSGFSKAADIHSVPSWVVSDARGRVLKKMAGASSSADDQIERLGLDPVSLASVRR